MIRSLPNSKSWASPVLLSLESPLDSTLAIDLLWKVVIAWQAPLSTPGLAPGVIKS